MDEQLNVEPLTEFREPVEVLSEELVEREAEYREISSSTEVQEEEYASMVESGLDNVVESVKPRFIGLLELVREQLDVVRQRLKEAYAHLGNLEADLRKHVTGDGSRSIIYYWILYLLVVGGNVLVFTATFSVIQPELPWWVGLFMGVVMAGPSLLIAYSYIRSPEKDRFLKYLHVVGLSAAVVAVIGAAISKTVGYHMVSSISTTSFLSGSSSSSWLERLHFVASTITFVALVATQEAFGGRLMILINESREDRRPYEQIREELAEAKRLVDLLESESETLGGQIAIIENFDSIAESWRKDKLHRHLMSLKVSQERLFTEAEDLALQKIKKGSLRDIINIGRR